jgi:hypothetical protein
LHRAWLDALTLALERSVTGLCGSQAYFTRVAFRVGGHHIETELTVVDQAGCLSMDSVYLRLASRMVRPAVSLDGRTWACVGADRSQDSSAATVVISSYFGLVWLLNIFGMALGLLVFLFFVIAMAQNDLAVLRPSMIADLSAVPASAHSEGGSTVSGPLPLNVDVRRSTSLSRDQLPSWAHFLAPLEMGALAPVDPETANAVGSPFRGSPGTPSKRRMAWEEGDLGRFGESPT